MKSLRHIRVFAVSAAIAACLTGCSQQIAARDRPTSISGPMDKATAMRLFAPDAIVSYGPAAEQHAELFLPKGKGPFPVLMFLHGGCWHSQEGSVEDVRPTMSILADHGIAVWNIGYRLLDQPGGGYPGTYQDIEAATRLLAKNARRYHLDLSRVVLSGHSAGAELAMWAAGRANIPASSPIGGEPAVKPRALVAISGPGDLKPLGPAMDQLCGANTYATLTGPASAARPDPLADTNPASLLPFPMPVTLLTGDKDNVVPSMFVEAFAKEAKAAGNKVTLTVIPGATHVAPIWPSDPAFKVTMKAILDAAGVPAAP